MKILSGIGFLADNKDRSRSARKDGNPGYFVWKNSNIGSEKYGGLREGRPNYYKEKIIMFNHLLAPLDGSSLAESVMPWLTALARSWDARVTILRVLDRPEMGGCLQPVDPLEWQMCKAEAESYLDGWSKRLREAGLQAEHVLREGNPAQRIIEYINNQGVDLIVASSHGRGGLSGWSAGSVIQKVVFWSRISVMLVRAHRPSPDNMEDLKIRKVLVPLDCSKRAECVLGPATTLTRLHNAKILLASVVRKPETPRSTPLSLEDLELCDRITERNREEAEKHLELLQSRLDADVETRLEVSDDVAVSLHELADKENVDLVALSAHGYSGKTKWTYGGVTNTFINYGNTPLLIVQDFAREQMELTEAEMAAKERKGH